ncbi:hypothetical protein [Exiguobacterium mexicanum]|uniref:hypothetical protein n=1 Tax=Exiguobacterium mexicanum TaxID=340146 RepID=UPI0037BEB878
MAGPVSRLPGRPRKCDPVARILRPRPKGVYRYLQLSERYGGEMPPVHIIDMRRELAKGNTTMFSEDLFVAINDRIAKKEQCVILLNRRGFTTFVMCRDCGKDSLARTVPST